MPSETRRPTLRVYDGLSESVLATVPTTDIPDVPKWVYLPDGDRLRTYGVVHRISADEHTVTVCGWTPDAEETDDRLDEMRDELWEFYRDAPTADEPVAPDGGRVYYFRSREDESFFGHKTPVPPKRGDGVTIDGEAYRVCATSTGVDEDGAFTIVDVTRHHGESKPPEVTEARRNLEGQRNKANTDWD